MKRGCFFSSIIILTIVIGIGFYLYKRYLPQIKEFGKEKVIKASFKDINEKITALDDSQYKDSLKVFLSEQEVIIKKKDFDDVMHNFSNIMKQVDFFIEDKSIDSVEFTALKNMAIKK